MDNFRFLTQALIFVIPIVILALLTLYSKNNHKKQEKEQYEKEK